MNDFVPDDHLMSWGRVQRTHHQSARPMWRDDVPALLRQAIGTESKVLAIGLGRSYGDSGLNPGGRIVIADRLDRLIAFDPETGHLRAEAGVSLEAMLRFLLPQGFILPVMPGTRWVTLGGMIANDVHGKNHHSRGTIGRFVASLDLLRSDGLHQRVMPSEQADLFAATIGGLGLTGIITEAEVIAVPVKDRRLQVERIPFHALDDFFSLSEESEASWEYTVSWVDCLASGPALGRGIFTRARHLHAGEANADDRDAVSPRARLSVPFAPPVNPLQGPLLKLFNSAYFAAGRFGRRSYRQSPWSFFFPLDAIGHWNRLYGRDGLYQYQCVIPPATAKASIRALLDAIARNGDGSFLAVLKRFGNLASPGMMSFPREGTTLALDFPNRGAATLALLSRLDAIVAEGGGRLYPAKDGRLPAAMFRAGYPRLAEFSAFVDPAFSSGFWRRVHE